MNHFDQFRQIGRRGYAGLMWLGHHELPMLLCVLVISGGAWLFVELAEAVMAGETRRLDTALLLALRNPANPADPLGPPWIEEMGRDFSALGSLGVLVLITLGVLGYLLLARRLRTALFTAVAVPGGMLLSLMLKTGFERPRPDLVPYGATVYTTSFPSSHAMMSAVVYLTLAALLSRTQPQWQIKAYLLLMAMLLSVLVGISRVYLGVHWPSDVLAGWTAGAGWAALCWLAMRAMQRRGQVEAANGESKPTL